MSEKKRVLVVGGSKGIGLSIVLTLIERGYDVDYTFNRTQEPGTAIDQALERHGRRSVVRALRCDVSKPEEIDAIRQHAAEHREVYYGLVYNAGVSADALAASVDLGRSRQLMDVNFWGFVNLYTSLYRHLDRSSGRIVAIGSIASQRHAVGNGIYAASKAALAAYVRAIACENGRRGLTANCVEPGYVDTEILDPYRDALKTLEAKIPARRIGWTADVANVVAFLLSSEGAYVNGTCLAVDGGLTATV